MKKPKRIKPKKGQESVWDYPRPPKLEKVDKPIEIYFNDTLLAKTNRAYRVLETSHPPVYYIPPEDINQSCLIHSDRITHCEFKGKGAYFHVKVQNEVAMDAAWYYDNPRPGFELIKNYPAFYANKMQKCLVGGGQIEPQPGDFYGGWVTSNIVGPFKGEEGTWGW